MNRFVLTSGRVTSQWWIVAVLALFTSLIPSVEVRAADKTSSSSENATSWAAYGAIAPSGLNTAVESSDTASATQKLKASFKGRVTSIAAGYFHACAAVDGGVMCWGDGSFGVLGRSGYRWPGPTLTKPLFVPRLGANSGVTDVVAPGAHNMCAFAGERVICWGQFGGQIFGDTLQPFIYSPTDITGLKSQQRASAKVLIFSPFCFVRDGGVKCIRRAESANSPLTAQTMAEFESRSGVTHLSHNGQFICVVQRGGVKCLGNNYVAYDSDLQGYVNPCAPDFDASSPGLDDEIDLRELACSWTPVEIPGLGPGSGVSKVWVGYNNRACAVASGGVRCWTLYGSISAPSTFAGLEPGSGVTDFVDGCAVINGGISCFDQTVGPVGARVPAGSGVTSIAHGQGNWCAVRDSGAQCWGLNQYGQLGNNSTTSSNVPVDVFGLSSSVTTPNLRYTQNPYVPADREPATRPQNCPKVMIFGFRGSGEQPNDYLFKSPTELLDKGQAYANFFRKQGFVTPERWTADKFLRAMPTSWYGELFGSSVGQHVEQLRKMLAIRRGISVQDVGIWSVGVDDLHLTNIWKDDRPQPIYQAAEVKKNAKYVQSIVKDSWSLASANLFQKYVSEICPNVAETYAVGYSQGAIFARQAISEVLETSPSKARGLLLLADPLFRFSADQCCINRGFVSDHVWNDDDADGIGHVKDLWRQSLAGTLQLPKLELLSKSFRVVTVCRNDDVVCDFALAHFLNSIHSDSYKLPKSSKFRMRARVSVLIE